MLSIDPFAVNTYTEGGWYVGAVVLEDYPNTDITIDGVLYTTADSLSLVPVQVSFLNLNAVSKNRCSTILILIRNFNP